MVIETPPKQRFSRNSVWTLCRLYLYSRAVLNLDCSLIFSSSRSIMSFGRPKGPKGPARGKSSRALLCSGIANRQYPSVEPGAKAHSFGELKFPLSQTLLARNGAT